MIANAGRGYYGGSTRSSSNGTETAFTGQGHPPKLTHYRRGSGSPQEDGPVDIVAIKKQVQANSMHESRFGKRKSFTNETTKALSERTIPALNMRCFACFLANLC